jgi:hypothetical protein
MSEQVYDKKAIIAGLRQNLNTSVIDFAKAIMELPEGDSEVDALKAITFSEIYKISSINNPDECLNELIKFESEFVENDKQKYLNISEIENLLKCDRLILSKTLSLLEMEGGMNGWKIKPYGSRRGKKYSLCRIQ